MPPFRIMANASAGLTLALAVGSCFAQCDLLTPRVYFVNGVLNTEQDANNSAKDLHHRLDTAALTLPGEQVTALYNPTNGTKGDLSEVFDQILNEHGGLTFFIVSRLVHGLLSGETLAGSSVLSLFTSAEQNELEQLVAGIAATHSPVDPGDPVLSIQLATYRSALQKGPVTVIAHSQGNLYTVAASDELNAEGLGTRWRMVSAGTPAARAPGGYVTSDHDVVIGAARYADPSVLPSNASAPIGTGGDYLGHGFAEVYLSDALSGALLNLFDQRRRELGITINNAEGSIDMSVGFPTGNDLGAEFVVREPGGSIARPGHPGSVGSVTGAAGSQRYLVPSGSLRAGTYEFGYAYHYPTPTDSTQPYGDLCFRAPGFVKLVSHFTMYTTDFNPIVGLAVNGSQTSGFKVAFTAP